MKRFLLLTFLVFSINGFGQKTITGQVIDKETKTPLKGANLVVLGSTYGTITNDSGYFQFEPKYKNSIARISYVGYSLFDIKLTTKKPILAELEKEIQYISSMNVGLGEYSGPSQYLEKEITNTEKNFDSLGITEEQFNEVVDEKADEIWTIVESPAEFYKGLDNLYAFFAANFIYPRRVLEENLSGNVLIEFTVLEDGSVDNIKFLKDDVPSEVKSELERLFVVMPKWTPATQRGKNVKQTFVLSIHYAANK